jgi:hypothetical protein
MAMTRFTVRLDDAIVDWARAEAARKSLPVGRFLGEIVTEQMREWRRKEHAARGIPAEPPARPDDPETTA